MVVRPAQAENLPIATNERIYEAYGVRRVW